MRAFADILHKLQEYNALESSIKNGVTPNIVTGVFESQKAHLCYSLSKRLNLSCVFITHNDMAAEKIYQDLSFFFKEKTFLFPDKEIIFYDVEAVSNDILFKRINALDKILNTKEPFCTVFTIDALRSFTVPKNKFEANTIFFEVGKQFDLQKLANDFVLLGYTREDMVEGRGQFSIRGGILDFFPYTSEMPFRIEFFDDEADSIREFDVITQLSVSKVDCAKATPAFEIILENDERQKLIKSLELTLKKLDKTNETQKIKDIMLQDIEKIKESVHFPSIDKYLPQIYKEKTTVLDYFNENTIYFIDEPTKISERAKSYDFEKNEQINSMLEKGIIWGKGLLFSKPYAQCMGELSHKKLIGLSYLSHSCPDFKPKNAYSITTKSQTAYSGKIDFLIDDLKTYKNKKYGVVILSGSKNRGIALQDNLSKLDIFCRFEENLNEIPKDGEILITKGALNKGFEYPLIKFALISDKEIFGTSKKQKKVSHKDKSTTKITAVSDLSVLDFVVHQNYGIGQFVGIHKLVVEGVTKDYLKIKYYGDDFLYVPVNQLDLINKYIGSDGKAVRLNKMSSSEWNKTIKRVKSSCLDLAKGLIELYGTRQSIKGHSFSADNEWQRQFEATFPYEETDDQLKSIYEVKEDMQNEKPMDRLLCGDVGYGKTEVAIRAAFKCALDGKQVAYLVPTTILAQQHYNNFKQRMMDFPVRVEMLSRFKTKKEQSQIINGLKTGEIDIVIGTHRLLQKDLKYKSLGLLIIDEEQRFGVSHKEKIKDIKKDIDVLTLTATPIPRTLHMAMVGIRDMSVIEQPPEDRYPVVTYVMEHNDDVILDAINREAARGGQVYYLYNRVSGIYKKAQSLQSRLPNINVSVAHGQMNENELEDIMMEVLNGNVNVLVCTTIIETGLDIPNVNTIIIEDADKMGLSQLYQLRGRVGRSNRLAYAYLTYKRDKQINEIAEKRLRAIKEFTEFGSGFKIAMRDLEIRGAGNLLGSEQHGHMDSVGYDMYSRLLAEAVKEVKGVFDDEKIQTNIDISVSAFIPESFIKSSETRIEIYKKIAAIESLQDSYDLEEEIEDRFSNLPLETKNLIDIALIRNEAKACKISEITQKGNIITFTFANEKSVDIEKITKLAFLNKDKIVINAGTKPYFTFKLPNNNQNEIVSNIKIILQQYKQL